MSFYIFYRRLNAIFRILTRLFKLALRKKEIENAKQAHKIHEIWR